MNRTRHIRKLYDQGSEYMSRWARHSSVSDLDVAYERFRELDGLVGDDSALRSLVDSQLGTCLASRAMLKPVVELSDLAQAKIPDIDALTAEHRRLPAHEPVAGPLSAVLGLALGIRSYSSGLPQDRRQAVGYLADGLSRAGRTDPWRGMALTLLAILLAQGVLADADA